MTPRNKRTPGNDDRGSGMRYLDMYVYRMPRSHRREFLRIERRANRIYRKFGGEGELLFLARKSAKKFGMLNISRAIPPKKQEELWVGLYFYRDRKHAREISRMVDSDREIAGLFKRFGELVKSASPVVQGELTRHQL